MIAIKSVKEDDQLMIVTTSSGTSIRMDLSEMRVLGRATEGAVSSTSARTTRLRPSPRWTAP